MRSEFRGQLPKPYAAGSGATSVIPSDMNDVNAEETSRYVRLLCLLSFACLIDDSPRWEQKLNSAFAGFIPGLSVNVENVRRKPRMSLVQFVLNWSTFNKNYIKIENYEVKHQHCMASGYFESRCSA